MPSADIESYTKSLPALPKALDHIGRDVFRIAERRAAAGSAVGAASAASAAAAVDVVRAGAGAGIACDRALDQQLSDVVVRKLRTGERVVRVDKRSHADDSDQREPEKRSSSICSRPLPHASC